MNNKTNILIVGAGFSGSVCARELAERGFQITIIDRRPHIGGNAYDKVDEYGVIIHPYGPHIFHTNSEHVFNWLSRFTEWNHYEHRVQAFVNQQYLPIPINRTTINKLYGLGLDKAGVIQYLEQVKTNRKPIQNSEDVVLNSVGHDLCDKFFRGYTRKQWGIELRELSAGVAARIPTRTNNDDRYFQDKFQYMPRHGYNQLFQTMLKHPNIKIKLSLDYREAKRKFKFCHIIYTGPIDSFYEYCFGCLPYRSLEFEHQHLPKVRQFQKTATINYPNDFLFTRITEFKHLTGQQHTGTSIVREYPRAEGEPYYPIPQKENEILYQRYKKLADQECNVTFVGRLAQYRYYNMDQVVAAALKASKNISKKLMEEATT